MSLGTRPRQIRMAKELWDEFGRAAKEDGTNRSALIRDWVLKYLKDRKGARPKTNTPR